MLVRIRLRMTTRMRVGVIFGFVWNLGSHFEN